MIAADKNLLKATLTQGVLQIQNNLITLYTNNLNNMAVISGLIAGFAYTGYIEAVYPVTPKDNVISYFFHPINVVCLIASLICVSQASIVSIFGPSMALTSHDSQAVATAVQLMREQQGVVFQLMVVAIVTLFVSTTLLSFAKVPVGVGVIIAFVFLTCGVLMYIEGKKAFDLFRVSEKCEL
jgi:hypothetical protein